MHSSQRRPGQPDPGGRQPQPTASTRTGQRPAWSNRFVIATVAALLAFAGFAIAVATPGLAAGGLSATFAKVNDWGSGYTARYTIANAAATAVNGWRVEFDLPASTTLSAFWEADVVRNGNHYTATGLSYNSLVNPGASVGFGFNAAGTGVPANCLLNGASCAAGGPTNPPSSPPPSSSPPSSPPPSSPAPGGDDIAPTAPANLRSTGSTSGSVSLAWNPSTDNVGVTGYDVINGSVVLAAGVVGTSTTVTGLIADTSYEFTVVARDAAGNTSAPSNLVTVRTAPAPAGGGRPTSITSVLSGLTIPWGMDWLPDGSALVTERDSFRVFRITQAGARTQVGTIPNAATTGGEGGALGLAVSPAFATDRQVFIFHTSPTDNRIVRMTFDGTSLSAPTVILSGIMRNTFHDGGRLKFGPDGFLYASTGDAQQTALAQDRNSLNGKILRLRTDGTAAPGNPFNNRTYSYGHRNPQGLAWDSAGRLWEAEFGNTQFDELNLITPGSNYGWPTCEGSCNVAGLTNPKRQWTTGEASPSGIAIVNDVVYMAALRGQRLWRIPLSGTETQTPEAFYVNQFGRMRTVEKVPGAQSLWLSTTNCDNVGNQPDGADQVFRVEIR